MFVHKTNNFLGIQPALCLEKSLRRLKTFKIRHFICFSLYYNWSKTQNIWYPL